MKIAIFYSIVIKNNAGQYKAIRVAETQAGVSRILNQTLAVGDTYEVILKEDEVPKD